MGIFNIFKKKSKITEDEFIKKLSEGEEEELSKVKSNYSDSPIENNLVPERHLSQIAWTVAVWRLTIEYANKKELAEAKVVKFCRLFLAQEKKRNKIKDFNRADVRILRMLSLACPLDDVDKLIKQNGWTLEVAKQFEDEIGY